MDRLAITPEEAMCAYEWGWIEREELFKYLQPADVLYYHGQRRLSHKTVREYFHLEDVDTEDEERRIREMVTEMCSLPTTEMEV